MYGTWNSTVICIKLTRMSLCFLMSSGCIWALLLFNTDHFNFENIVAVS